jgi:hypothetical protein
VIISLERKDCNTEFRKETTKMHKKNNKALKQETNDITAIQSITYKKQPHKCLLYNIYYVNLWIQKQSPLYPYRAYLRRTPTPLVTREKNDTSKKRVP